jgi:integrase
MRPDALLTPLYLQTLAPRAKEYSVGDVQCPDLKLRVQPGGTRSWVLSRRMNGKARRITLGTWPEMTPEEARASFHAELARLTPPAPHEARGAAGRQPVARTLPFATLAAHYLADQGKHFKPSSQVPFRAYLEAQLLPAFGNHPVGEITPAQVADWFHAYSRSRPGGANQALGHFTTILNWGKAKGYLPHDLPNPASPIRRNRRKARGRMLSFEQIRGLAGVLEQAQAKHWRAAQAIRLILLTGCRRGEILSLRWSDVKRTRLALRDAKTGPRDVFLSKPARETLTRLRRQTGNGTFVFPSSRARSGHIESVAQSWAQFREHAGLPDDIRIHDLRHTYASHAILAGESLPTTGKLLGHKSPSSTKRYTHLDGSTLAKAADRISKEINSLLSG